MTSWDTESFGTALSRENAVRMDVSVVGSFSKEIVGEKKKFRVFVVEVSQKGQSRLVQLRFSNYAKLWKEVRRALSSWPSIVYLSFTACAHVDHSSFTGLCVYPSFLLLFIFGTIVNFLTLRYENRQRK